VADGNDQTEVSQTVEQYAEQAKKDLNGDGSGGWLGGIFDTIADMGAKADAMTAAANAGQFAMSPDLAAAMTKQFNEMQDLITQMTRRSDLLTRKTPLGGGYGVQIADMNATVGQNASTLLGEFNRKVQALREAVEKSVANYKQVDGDSSGSLNKIG
jgi:hypothetical protein